MSQVLSVRVDDETRDKLDALAADTGRSRSWLAAEALRRYVESEAWQVAEIRAALMEAEAGDFASDAEVAVVVTRWAARARK